MLGDIVMARKFGSSDSNRVGTGRINHDESGSEKWAGSVAAQVATAANVKGILTKTIPIAYVLCDPQNPRKLAITQQQIIEIAIKYPIDKSLLEVEESTDWIDDYVMRVVESEVLKGKAVGDFQSLVEFAGGLKSASRMLHPIVVWKDESTFHLIAGERRLLTHILLSETNIAARIVEQGYSRSEIDTLQWEENVHRVDMNLLERVERIKKIVESGEGIANTSVSKLSKIIGRSRAESQRYLAILRYPNQLLINAIRQGIINDLKVAANLAQLSTEDLEAKLTGKAPSPKLKSFFKFGNKQQVPYFGEVIKAAAKHLKMEALIKQADLSKLAGINEAIELLIAELEDRNHG
jgi:ParB/RepB/Spo0J family partition protein